MSHDIQACPICGSAVAPSPRYPIYLCAGCARRATAADGRRLCFGNESWSGGYVAWYADTREPYSSHECLVDGVRCRADEHHMGGIVIRPVQDPS